MFKKTALFFSLAAMGISVSHGDTPVKTPRPIPATRTEMKELLEDMKKLKKEFK